MIRSRGDNPSIRSLLEDMARERQVTNAALTSSADATAARDENVDSSRPTHSRSNVPFLVRRLKQSTSLDLPAVWTLRSAVVSFPNSIPRTSCSSTMRKFPRVLSVEGDGEEGGGVVVVVVVFRCRFNSARHVNRFRYSDGGGGR
jgi:hypothetical protein